MGHRHLTASIALVLGLLVSMAAAQEKRAAISAALNATALQAGQQQIVAVILEIKPGFHAQSHTPLDPNLIALEVKPDPNPALEFGPAQYPPPQIENYPALGRLSVYTGRTIVSLPVQLKGGTKPGPIRISGTVSYQICDDKSCFAPETAKFEIQTHIAAPQEHVDLTSIAVAPPAKEQWSIPLAFGAAIIAGLLFNVMPCVLPVLPLKAVGFYEVSQHRRSRSMLLGLIFSLGLISVFAVLSLVVLVFRAVSWGDLFSLGWFIWTIVAVLIVLGFGLLGGWNLSLPMGIYRFEPRHDTLGGNFFWGALTAILATPCTAPLLPPVLLWAAQHRAYIGVPAVIMVGVGMAIPYLILSAMPELARRFPRSGPWSELFKQMMGFLLLASAAYFAAGRLIGGPEFWWTVVGVVAIAALFLVGRTVQLSQSARAVGIAATLAVLMLGGSLWWTVRITGFFQPSASASGQSTQDNWQAYSDDRFNQLRQSGKPVLVKFTANWCATCQYIEGTVFRDPRVWKALNDAHVTTLKVDLTSQATTAPGHDLLLKLNPSGGIPLTAIWGPGAEQPVQLSSIYSSSQLFEALQQATGTP